MTVCIASICRQEDCIIAITDSMLSLQGMSADHLAIKFTSIGSRWMAMFAGNDISPVVPIFKTVKNTVDQMSDETLEEIVDAFRSAIRKENILKSEAVVLSSFNLNVPEFLDLGLAKLGPDLFTRLAYEIQQVSLDLTFLVCGFEGTQKPEPHIFTIDGKAEVAYYDRTGFWAIGSGQTSALGMLFGTRIPLIYNSIPDTLYLLAKAKFSAESALGVGKDTTALVLRSNSERYVVQSKEMGEIKNIWEQSRGPDVPIGADDFVSKVLEGAKTKFENR